MIDVIELNDISFFKEYRGIGLCLELPTRHAMKNYDYGDPSDPSCSDFSPYIWTLKCPWREQHQQFVGFI